jgi:hypothetical protein
MNTEPLIIPGIVQGGLIVPQGGAPLAEGLLVQIVVRPSTDMNQLRQELAEWDAASDEAWGINLCGVR